MSGRSFILFLSLIVTVKISDVSSANILVWQVIGSHSTRISMWPLMEALSEKGHNVTIISAFENQDKSASKVTQVVPRKWQKEQGGWEKEESFFGMRKDPWSVPKFFNSVYDIGILSCKMIYTDPEFLAWMTSKDRKFDLIIIESAWNDCAYGQVHLLNTKVMIYGTSHLFPYMADPFGIPDETSHVSDMFWSFKTSKNSPMKFWQRFLNAFAPIYDSIRREWFYMPELEKITREALNLKENELPRFLDIEKNVSAILLSTHYSIGATRSYPPNVIPIGGAVVSTKLKPLPKDMEKFIDSAKNGFIFISFGTCAEFVNFDNEVQKQFIAGVASFPDIKFIWKSSFPIKHPLPDNVLVAKWAPQQTLLAHPKIKAFITHAGQGSSLEAIHFAVPTVCIPILADQDINTDKMVEMGAGIKVEVLTLTKEDLQFAIKEVLNNPKYRNGMKRLSQLFSDRPRPPLEEAVWWVEYVLRHDKIHEILMPASIHQSWWVRRQLDVWYTAALLLLVIIQYTLDIVAVAIVSKSHSVQNILALERLLHLKVQFYSVQRLKCSKN